MIAALLTLAILMVVGVVAAYVLTGGAHKPSGTHKTH